MAKPHSSPESCDDSSFNRTEVFDADFCNLSYFDFYTKVLLKYITKG